MASIGERAVESIKSRAKAKGIDPFAHLQRFALERVMYRIAESCGRQVMLKGSAIDLVTGDSSARAIDDIDIALELPVDEIEEHMPAILGGRYYSDDGLVDDALEVTRIKARRIETESRTGVAFRLECFVGRTRINVIIDATADADIHLMPNPTSGREFFRHCRRPGCGVSRWSIGSQKNMRLLHAWAS